MSKTKPIRIVIADDHVVVRDGIAAILGMQPDMKVVGQASNGEEACALFEKHAPDLMLLDLRMPKMDGLDVIRRIHSRHPGARIVIVTTYDDDEDIFRALKAGAQGYLLKDASRQQISEAIRVVHAGQRYIPANVALKMAKHVSRPELTEREHEVLRRMARGESNKEIGNSLSISEGTVKTHVKSILSKLGVAGRTEAVATASQRGLVQI
ncbi:MAG TPA: response regulator transcription factor [Clostridia bacterium]|nr:response regulator transcription factor [Clostridia bacterium]